MNAAVSASVVLASRLTTDVSVFALMLFSIQAFALFPMLRHRLQASTCCFSACPPAHHSDSVIPDFFVVRYHTCAVHVGGVVGVRSFQHRDVAVYYHPLFHNLNSSWYPNMGATI